MKTILALLSAAALSLLPIAPAHSQEISIKGAAPVVVKTVPESGATEVDAAKTTELRVTFSKPMLDRSWSWTTYGDDRYFPKFDGQPRYLADQRTCVVKVKLEPGRTYAVLLNSAKFGNFRDAEGHPAMPYLLIFQTKP